MPAKLREKKKRSTSRSVGRTLAAFFALAVACQMAVSAPAWALEVIVFAGGFNWPIWSAQQQGYFATNGVEVHLTPTPGSEYQLKSLIEGKFDLAMTAIDNVIAYDEGQGEASVSVKPNLVAVMGGDNGFLRLVTVPEVTSYAALKGKTLTVDARTTGYAFVLEKMLQLGGLGEGEYELVKVGGVLARFEDLMLHNHAGTLLLSPFEVSAEANGFIYSAAPLTLLAAIIRGWSQPRGANGLRSIQANWSATSAAISPGLVGFTIRATGMRQSGFSGNICRTRGQVL